MKPENYPKEELFFDKNGKFKILVLADCQDNEKPNRRMIKYINFLLDAEKPNLVVFLGDNVVCGTNKKFEKGSKLLLTPLVLRGIPYCFCFGNHDAEYGVSKKYMLSVFSKLGKCYTYNADDSIDGVGNCVIKIKSSNKKDTAFAVWMIDSNMYYGKEGSFYDIVHESQLNWFKKESEKLNREAGKTVNSLVFQHMIVTEVFDLLRESKSGKHTVNGKKYALELNEKANGTLLELPCPPYVNGGELDALCEAGGVLAAVFGHDHNNSFIGSVKGIDLIQTAGMTFNSYGDGRVRGCRIIELDESDTSNYKTYTRRYIDDLPDSRCGCKGEADHGDGAKEKLKCFLFKITGKSS